MQQSVVNVVRPSRSRVALYALGALTGYGALYQYNKYQQVNAKWEDMKAQVAATSEESATRLDGFDAMIYPWVRENNVRDWEFKPVTLRGYFKDERFFVRRVRDGSDGFLVFAAFVTAVERVNHRLKQKELLPIEHSVFVNLGWVPFNKKGDVELGGEVSPAIDAPTDTTLFVDDFETGLNPNPENPEESEQLSLTEITGIVRRGETSNILAGRRNWNQLGVYNWVDLDYMGKILRLFNLDSVNTAYIERIVPAPEEDEEESELYPIPSNKNTFEKPLDTPCLHKLLASVFTASSLLSIVAATLL